MIGWIDATAGASGDMLLGALLDAGVPLEVIQAAIDAVVPEPVNLSTGRVDRNGILATRCHVEVADSHTHRHWTSIRARLSSSELDPVAKDLALDAFERLASAEGAVHGIDPEEVHFHEVGALDAIADVVGVCAGFAHLGLDRVTASMIAVGSGRIDGTAHGTLPVPPPAVVRLLGGVPTNAGPGVGESCTPTGATLLRTLAAGFGGQPPMMVELVGTGAGGRNPETHANVVRLLIGREVNDNLPDTPMLLEANVDDLDPRIWPVVIQELFDAGASDAWLTPIVMKKGRPAHTLSAFVTAAHVDAVRAAMFRHSTTIGLRGTRIEKSVTDHELVAVDVEGHPINIKVARHEGTVVNVQPEYEDVRRAAVACDLPVKVMLASAAAAAVSLWTSEGRSKEVQSLI